jgi:hypothetical protein
MPFACIFSTQEISRLQRYWLEDSEDFTHMRQACSFYLQPLFASFSNSGNLQASARKQHTYSPDTRKFDYYREPVSLLIQLKIKSYEIYRDGYSMFLNALQRTRGIWLGVSY